MAVTLVAARHADGSWDCHARHGNGNRCPGGEHAAWLNGLGDDDAQYARLSGCVVTNGMVRSNWLRDSAHIVAVDRERARLAMRRQQLRAELRQVNRQLRALPGGVR